MLPQTLPAMGEGQQGWNLAYNDGFRVPLSLYLPQKTLNLLPSLFFFPLWELDIMTVALPKRSLPLQTQRVVLNNISWQTYQVVLAELGNHRSARLAYDCGVLEITMPSDLHEMIKRLLERIVTTLTEELNLKVRSVGSVTLEREDLQRGAEPDSGFYIQNATQICGQQIDLQTSPPPDLVIEVDITRSSKQRLAICCQLGVPEVWRCNQTTLEIYQLQSGAYVLCQYSPTFPMVSGAILKQFVDRSEQIDDDNAIVRTLRDWVRKQIELEK